MFLQSSIYVAMHVDMEVAYRKFPNISPGLIEVRRNFWWACIRGGLIFCKSFGLTDDLFMPKNSPFDFQSERPITALKMRKTSQGQK